MKGGFCTLRITSTFNFGKYKHTNKHVFEILDKDPAYLKWCIENTNCHPSADVLEALKQKGYEVEKLHPQALKRLKNKSI